MPPPPEPSSTDSLAWEPKFTQSTWFSGGWTLQEMIALLTLIFYADNWTTAGTKEELASAMKTRTGVPYNVLATGDLSNTSIVTTDELAAHSAVALRKHELSKGHP